MRRILLENNCFLVHGFSSNSKKGTLYEMIDFVLSNSNEHELCVSTVIKGDHSKRNFFQPVGLIIGNCTTVNYCRNIDGGTYRLPDGDLIGETEGGIFKPTNVQIKETITDRPSKSYNEFRIEEYTVVGFYISKDEGELGVVTNIIQSEYLFYSQTIHYGLPYYFVVDGELNEVVFDKDTLSFKFLSHISIQELYKA